MIAIQNFNIISIVWYNIGILVAFHIVIDIILLLCLVINDYLVKDIEFFEMLFLVVVCVEFDNRLLL